MNRTTNMPDTRTILICEDEAIVAMDVALTVGDLGHRVMGPCASRAEAEQLVAQAVPDAAVLDVNLRDGEVFPLADKLRAAGVRLIFQSGHSRLHEIEHRFPEAEFCEKPVPPAAMEAAVQRALDAVPRTAVDNAAD